MLHNGASLAEVSNTINAVTGLGVISGIKALATDFAGYTADQIEHHASTMPHDMGGWWIQPIGTRMKTDDLALGDTAYDYSLDAYGLMGGYDLRMGDWTLGLAGSYQEGDADSEGDVLPASTDIKSKAAHLWAAKTYGETYVIGTLSYLNNSPLKREGFDIAEAFRLGDCPRFAVTSATKSFLTQPLYGKGWNPLPSEPPELALSGAFSGLNDYDTGVKPGCYSG